MTLLMNVFGLLATGLATFLTSGQSILEDIFTEAVNVVTYVITFFGNAITAVIALFWVSGTGLTQYGKLFIIPAGFAVFYKVMKWVGRLIRIR